MKLLLSKSPALPSAPVRKGSFVLSCFAVCLTLFSFVPLRPAPASADDAAAGHNVQLRGSLDNCRIRFEREKKGRVAFLGGSITEMNGYRPLVMKWLQQRFPDTQFTFTNAGIASTCSTTGAFRLATDVLDPAPAGAADADNGADETPRGKGRPENSRTEKAPVDLLFVEFAVNDDQDAHHSRNACIRGMEGIVRHLRRKNPLADVVITYFVNPEMLAQLQAGKTPLPIAAHEEVARHYGISTIYLAREVAERIEAGKLTWEEYGGTHPKLPGNSLCAAMIAELFERAWKRPLAADARPRLAKLPEPLDPLCYANGRFIDPGRAELKQGWKLQTPEWDKLEGSKRSRFTQIKMLCATEPGATLELAFNGTAIGAYVVAGPDAGMLEASIDGGPFRLVDLYHHFSAGLHYPRTVMFAADLSPGRHTLVLRTGKRSRSSGHAARIMQFVAN